MTQRMVRNAIATCAVLLGLVLADTLRTHAQAPQSNADPRTTAPSDQTVAPPDRTVARRTGPSHHRPLVPSDRKQQTTHNGH
jgi:hypothetical protein